MELHQVVITTGQCHHKIASTGKDIRYWPSVTIPIVSLGPPSTVVIHRENTSSTPGAVAQILVPVCCYHGGKWLKSTGMDLNKYVPSRKYVGGSQTSHNQVG